MRLDQFTATLSTTTLGLAIASALASPALVAAPVSLADYLPSGSQYAEDIPRPAEVLGFEVGEWHVRHDLLVEYMKAVAEASDRARFEIQGTTHEDRKQTLLVITSPDNMERLDQIREDHRALSDPARSGDIDLENLPAVVFLGYSIHGNEASGSNASMLTAYHLTASRSPEVMSWLERVVVLLDPSLNPDGLGRFAQWVNMHRATGPLIADSQNREHNEVWPGGRTNHYWFDLNRDWLLLQHPESRNRVRTFHAWKPDLLGDFHEMGTNSTFFFQPGIPERKNPNIPDSNVELTERLAEFHAKNLVESGKRLFYTQESFDDFYPGKGSTYPDIQGSVGVLFEQASARGHVQESVNGDLTFPFGIKNHFLASLSMVEGLAENRRAFLEHRRDFVRERMATLGSQAHPGYIYGTAGDPGRMQQIDSILLGHDVEVYPLTEEVTVDGATFEPEWARYVPLSQPQATLIETLFTTQTEFESSIFYDVSTWTLPLAFDVSFAAAPRGIRAGSEPLTEAVLPPGKKASTSGDVYAWLFDWRSETAPRALQRLHEAGAQVRVLTRDSTLESDSGRRVFPPGTVVVPAGLEANGAGALEEALEEIATVDGIDIYTVTSGLALGGIDVGSPSARPIDAPKVAIVYGDTISSYRVGELWHLLDHRYQVPVSLVESGDLGQLDLERYTHLVFPDGNPQLSDGTRDSVRAWTRNGGTVIGTGTAAVWAGDALLGRSGGTASDSEASEETGRELRQYGDFEDQRAEEILAGAFFGGHLDTTHPLAYGYPDAQLAFFRIHTQLMPPSPNPFENLAWYNEGDPRLSGYSSPSNRERLAGQPAAIASKLGSGLVVQLIDPVSFRSWVRGPNRLFLNAIFLADAVSHTSSPDNW